MVSYRMPPGFSAKTGVGVGEGDPQNKAPRRTVLTSVLDLSLSGTHLESLEPARRTQRGATEEPLPGLEAQPCSRRNNKVRLATALRRRLVVPWSPVLFAEDRMVLWVVPLP